MMKKRKTMNKIDDAPRHNPVAKFARQFNKAQVFADKKHYSRKPKHGKQEVSPTVLV
jgi:hypothetical protein